MIDTMGQSKGAPEGSNQIPAEETEYAIGIVGLGPCGLMAAIEMGQKLGVENPGKKIVVFEKRAKPTRQQGVVLNQAKDFIMKSKLKVLSGMVLLICAVSFSISILFSSIL